MPQDFPVGRAGLMRNVCAAFLSRFFALVLLDLERACAATSPVSFRAVRSPCLLFCGWTDETVERAAVGWCLPAHHGVNGCACLRTAACTFRTIPATAAATNCRGGGHLPFPARRLRRVRAGGTLLPYAGRGKEAPCSETAGRRAAMALHRARTSLPGALFSA